MSSLCHVLEVSSVEEEEDVRRGRRTNLGMEDMAQIGGLVAGHGREEVCWPW